MTEDMLKSHTLSLRRTYAYKEGEYLICGTLLFLVKPQQPSSLHLGGGERKKKELSDLEKFSPVLQQIALLQWKSPERDNSNCCFAV